jgi:hypothetical protein
MLRFLPCSRLAGCARPRAPGEPCSAASHTLSVPQPQHRAGCDAVLAETLVKDLNRADSCAPGAWARVCALGDRGLTSVSELSDII